MLADSDLSQQEYNHNQDNPVINAEVIEPPAVFPPIASIWRRFFAWAIDTLLLSVLGWGLGLIFSSFFCSLGPYGRPIGLIVTLPYFGILNSRLGGGQTLGKRLLKIAVRNNKNEPISLGRSLIRISILAIPALFNGWGLPIFSNPVIIWFLSLLIFGLGGAIFYTMVFNIKTRQGIHDMFLGTYVVYLPGKPVVSYPTTAKIHWYVPAIWTGLVAIAAIVMATIAPNLIANSPSTNAGDSSSALSAKLSSLMELSQTIYKDPRFFSVNANDHTFYSADGQTTHLLVVTVWYKGRVTENGREDVVLSIAKIVLDNYKDLDDYDGLQIKIISGFDIGIASGNYSMFFTQSIENWSKQVYPNGPSSGFIPPAWSGNSLILPVSNGRN